MSSDNTYGGPSGANNSTIEYAENAIIDGVSGKKVFNVDSTGNIIDGATSANQDAQITLLQGIAGMIPSGYDYIGYTDNATSDVYTYKTGGSGGTTVATITVNFTDTTKDTLAANAVVKT